MSGPATPVFAFGPFRLDSHEQALLRDGVAVPLTPKALELLSCLVAHSGRLLRKEELLAIVWPGTFVEEAVLSVNVSSIRKALGDDRNRHIYIETVSGFGYRFRAPVTPIETADADAPASDREVAPDSPAIDVVARHEQPPQHRLRLGWVAGALPASARSRRIVTTISIALVAGPLLTAAGWWAGRPWTPASTVQPMRFAIVPPATQPLAITGFDRNVVISPDGTRVVYVGSAARETQLMVREVGQLDAVPLHGITGVRGPFVSPDSRWIGFFTGPNGEIKKVSITGGPPLALCQYAAAPRGASWGPDDTIVFATSDPTTGLLSVSAAGGEPKVVTTPDRAHGEQDHVFPSVLPGARAVLFTITTAGPAESARVAVLDLKTGQYKTLVRNGSQAEYVATGYLVYAVAGTLRAVRFDPVRLEVLSDPVPVIDHVMTLETGATEFSLSRQGLLVYVPGGGLTGVTRALAWVNRHGQEESLKAPPRAYVYPRISPDGTRLALDIRDQENDIWIWDLARQTLTRLTTDPALDAYPVWTPDSRRVIFASARAGILNLFWQPADNTGSAERLTTSPNPQSPDSISPAGTRLIFGELIAKTGTDLQVLRMDFPSTGTVASQRRTEPLVHTTFNEENGELSPDGRWLAYQSNESGQYEVYVRMFPHADSGHWQISTSGGTTPVWARNGLELFYRDGANAVTAVPIVGPNFSAGTPTKLFDGRYFAATGRTYDVSPDGQRFLMIKDNTAGDQASTPASMIVVLNWVEELEARMPTK